MVPTSQPRLRVSELWESIVRVWGTGVPTPSAHNRRDPEPEAVAPETTASAQARGFPLANLQTRTFEELLGTMTTTLTSAPDVPSVVPALHERVCLDGIEVVRHGLGLPMKPGRVIANGFGGWEDDLANDLDLLGSTLDVAKIKRMYTSGNPDLMTFLHEDFDRATSLVPLPDLVTGRGLFYSPRTDPNSWSAPDAPAPASTYRDDRPCLGLEPPPFDEPVTYRLDGDDYAVWWPAASPPGSGFLGREAVRPEGWQGIGLIDSTWGGGVLEFMKRDLALTLAVRRLSAAPSVASCAGLRTMTGLMVADNAAEYVPVRFDSWRCEGRVLVSKPRRDPRDGCYRSLQEHALALFWYPNRLSELSA